MDSKDDYELFCTFHYEPTTFDGSDINDVKSINASELKNILAMIGS